MVRFENPGKLGKISFSSDGRSIAMISAADEHDPAAGRLVVGSLESGQMRDVLPDYPGHVADIAWSGPGTIAFVGDEGTGTVIGTVGIDGSGLSTTTTGDLVVSGFSVAINGRAAALIAQSPRHPGEVFRAEIGGNPKTTRLTDSNPWLARMEFAPQEVVSYRARDGLDLQGIMIRPLGLAPGARSPLVLDVHGGPESHVRHGWVTSYSMPGQVLAAQGIAVFLPNYRGSTGRGVAFSKLSQGDPAGKEFDDLADAVDHFVNTGLAERSKVGITGGSYGGYATAWCSTRYSDRFAAGVMFVGISNKISKAGTTDIPDEEYLVHIRKRLWEEWQGLLERSPIFHADKARTPLLILHGKEDPPSLHRTVAEALSVPQTPKPGAGSTRALPRGRSRRSSGGLPARLQPADGRLADSLPSEGRRVDASGRNRVSNAKDRAVMEIPGPYRPQGRGTITKPRSSY